MAEAEDVAGHSHMISVTGSTDLLLQPTARSAGIPVVQMVVGTIDRIGAQLLQAIVPGVAAAETVNRERSGSPTGAYIHRSDRLSMPL